jgi:hypothetical protein
MSQFWRLFGQGMSPGMKIRDHDHFSIGFVVRLSRDPIRQAEVSSVPFS